MDSLFVELSRSFASQVYKAHSEGRLDQKHIELMCQILDDRIANQVLVVGRPRMLRFLLNLVNVFKNPETFVGEIVKLEKLSGQQPTTEFPVLVTECLQIFKVFKWEQWELKSF